MVKGLSKAQGHLGHTLTKTGHRQFGMCGQPKPPEPL